MNDMTYANHKPLHREDRITFVMIFAPCFLLLLAVAMLGQLVGLHWENWLPGAEHKSSIFSGVHAAVYSLMSHII